MYLVRVHDLLDLSFSTWYVRFLLTLKLMAGHGGCINSRQRSCMLPSAATMLSCFIVRAGDRSPFFAIVSHPSS